MEDDYYTSLLVFRYLEEAGSTEFLVLVEQLLGSPSFGSDLVFGWQKTVSLDFAVVVDWYNYS